MPEPLTPERVADIRERAERRLEKCRRRGQASLADLECTKNEVHELAAEIDRLRAELDNYKDHLGHLERHTLPQLRREIEHHQDGKKRWRDRAEKAEAELAAQEQSVEYGIDFGKGVCHTNGFDRVDQEARLSRWRDTHPAASLVQRTVRYGAWTEAK